MKRQFVTYEIAVALKELGFDEQCLGYYYHENEYTRCNPCIQHNTDFWWGDYDVPAGSLKAPLWQQATDWLRETHGINVEANYLPNVKMYGVIVSDMDVAPRDLSREENIRRANEVTLRGSRFETRREALERAVHAAVNKASDRAVRDALKDERAAAEPEE